MLINTDVREMKAAYRQYEQYLKPGVKVPDFVYKALPQGLLELFVDPKTGLGRGDKYLDTVKSAVSFMGVSGLFAAGLNRGASAADITDALKTADISKLSPAAKMQFGRISAGTAGLMVSEEARSGITPLQPLTGEAGAAQLAAIAQATGQSGQVLQAQKMLGETAPMSLISQVMTTAARTADVEQAGKEAAQAGEKMTIDTSKFDASVTRFSEAVDKLSEAVRPFGMSRSATSSLGGGSEFFERFGGPVTPEYAIKNLNRVK
jgi:hypothetical protein